MDFMSVEEVTRKIKVKGETVLRWIKTGALSALDLGDQEGYRIESKDLEAFLEQQRQAGPSREVADLWVQKDINKYLCLWLKKENEELAKLYRELDQVLLKIGEKIRTNLEMAIKSGDYGRGKVYNAAMELVHRRWSKQRKAYQRWLLAHEKRWENQAKPVPALLNLELLEGHLLNKKEELKSLFLSRASFEKTQSPDSFNQLEEDLHRYRKLLNWLEQEQGELRKYYLEMERYIKKIAGELKAGAKKAAKEMDFIRGQVFNDTLVNLYVEWENHKKNYNQLMINQEERWKNFKNEVRL